MKAISIEESNGLIFETGGEKYIRTVIKLFYQRHRKGQLRLVGGESVWNTGEIIIHKNDAFVEGQSVHVRLPPVDLSLNSDIDIIPDDDQ